MVGVALLVLGENGPEPEMRGMITAAAPTITSINNAAKIARERPCKWKNILKLLQLYKNEILHVIHYFTPGL